jgi:hypothetical protein
MNTSKLLGATMVAGAPDAGSASTGALSPQAPVPRSAAQPPERSQ